VELLYNQFRNEPRLAQHVEAWVVGGLSMTVKDEGCTCCLTHHNPCHPRHLL
jgi:hypothetical protein